MSFIALPCGKCGYEETERTTTEEFDRHFNRCTRVGQHVVSLTVGREPHRQGVVSWVVQRWRWECWCNEFGEWRFNRNAAVKEGEAHVVATGGEWLFKPHPIPEERETTQ